MGIRLRNIRARLGNRKTKFENVKPQISFSKTNKIRHLELYLPGLNNN